MNTKRLILAYTAFAIFILLAVYGIVRAEVYGSSLIGWWNMDSNQISGGIIQDLSSSDNDLTATNVTDATFYVGTPYGQGVACAGDDDYLTQQNTEFGALTAVTVSFWMKTSAAADGSFHGIISKGTPDGYESFIIAMGSTGDNPNKVLIYFITNSGASGNIATVSNMNTGQWKHYAWTWTSAGTYNVYVNGVLETTGTRTGANLVDSDDEIRFCAYKNPSFGGYFNGSLDDVRFYNRALSASEISQLYQSSKQSPIMAF